MLCGGAVVGTNAPRHLFTEWRWVQTHGVNFHSTMWLWGGNHIVQLENL